MLRYLSYNKLPYHGFSQKSCGVAVNSPGNITLSKYLLFTGIFFYGIMLYRCYIYVFIIIERVNKMFSIKTTTKKQFLIRIFLICYLNLDILDNQKVRQKYRMSPC